MCASSSCGFGFVISGHWNDFWWVVVVEGLDGVGDRVSGWM